MSIVAAAVATQPCVRAGRLEDKITGLCSQQQLNQVSGRPQGHWLMRPIDYLSFSYFFFFFFFSPFLFLFLFLLFFLFLFRLITTFFLVSSLFFHRILYVPCLLSSVWVASRRQRWAIIESWLLCHARGRLSIQITYCLQASFSSSSKTTCWGREEKFWPDFQVFAQNVSWETQLFLRHLFASSRSDTIISLKLSPFSMHEENVEHSYWNSLKKATTIVTFSTDIGTHFCPDSPGPRSFWRNQDELWIVRFSSPIIFWKPIRKQRGATEQPIKQPSYHNKKVLK